MPQLIIKIDLDASADSIEPAQLAPLESVATTLANDVRRLSHNIEMLQDLAPSAMQHRAVDTLGRPIGEWWIE